MTRRLILALCIGATLTAAAEKPVILRYTFTPEFAVTGPSLHVVLTFQGSETGNSKLILPTTWAGQSDLFNAVRNLKSEDSQTVIKTTDAIGVRILQYSPKRTIRISYDLMNDWTGDLRHPKEFRVVVRIRTNSSNKSSLDDRMFALLESPEKALSTDVLITSLTKDLPAEDAAALRSFVESGRTIPLPKELQPNCGLLVFENDTPHYKLRDGCRIAEFN